jgi:hypothetical protein
MSWERQVQNMKAKDRSKREHFSARNALERFRRTGDPSGFPDLNRRVSGSRGFNLSGFYDKDVNPRLTQEEFDKFKAAYEASDAGKAAKAKFEEWLREIREE